jgi:hypothetical protein
MKKKKKVNHIWFWHDVKISKGLHIEIMKEMVDWLTQRIDIV